MHRTFQRFVDHLAECNDAATLRTCMADLARALEFNAFAYLSLPETTSSLPKYVSNYSPEWTAHYLENNYQRIDPVIRCASSSSYPFEWGLKNVPGLLTVPQKKMFEEAATHGICCGFTVPVHECRPVAALTFATDASNKRPFRRRIEADGRLLQLVAFCFHERVRRSLAPNRRIGAAVLSARELECLQWTARGKSAWEIGKILGISRHTVTFHLENAKSKLGVRTIVQAAARLAESGRSSD